MRSALTWSLATIVVIVALGVPGASADVIAAVEVPSGTSFNCPVQWNLALINAATGERTALPAGINTSADEFHPSISSFGSRLVFNRVDPVGGTSQIVAADLTTGQQAPLFNVFDATQLQPSTPSLAATTNSVLTGTVLAPGPGSQFTPAETVTSLSNFPGGPFPHTQQSFNTTFASAGSTANPVERSDGVRAFQVSSGTGSSRTEAVVVAGPSSIKVDSESGFVSNPALSDPTTNVALFVRSAPTPVGTLARVFFRPVNTFDTATSVALPAAVNAAGNDVLHPSFTPDGRYLGFVQVAHDGDFHDRLFLFDTETQLMVNSDGIDLGDVGSFGCKATSLWSGSGGLSLRETFTLRASSLQFSGSLALVAFQLAGTSGVGILVQRIVGHHRLFGHRVPTLKTVGRVPLGKFKRGRHTKRWNLRVNGHRLHAGSYLVTPRLLTAKGVVRELGKPRVLKIR
jgi:hypothetical protein